MSTVGVSTHGLFAPRFSPDAKRKVQPPKEKKETSGEDKRSEHQIGSRGAVSAAGLQGNGSRRKWIDVH